MKNVLDFIIGVGVCLLIVVTIAHFSTNVSADSSSPSTTSDSDLIGLIPNVGEIYNRPWAGPIGRWSQRSLIPILLGTTNL